MKSSILIVSFLVASLSSMGQNVAVLTHGAANTPEYQRGCPSNWPASYQEIGASTNLPDGLQSPPWIVETREQLDQRFASLEAAKEFWNQVAGTREARKQRVGEVLQDRIASGQWEPNRLRLHALESELFGKLMQAFRLNSELLLLVTKAIAPSTLTTNLTAPERARVTALRSQLSFAQAPDLTQADRDRVIFITAELSRIETLWKEARALRANIETNSVFVDPASLSTTIIGE
jgi:hypothetical protein